MRGIVDIWGYATPLEGFIFGGWIDSSWDSSKPMPAVRVEMERESVTGSCLMCLYPRADVEGRGLGYLMLALVQHLPGNAVKKVALLAEDPFELIASNEIELYDEPRLFVYAKHFLDQAQPDEMRVRFGKLLERPHYAGVDTISTLTSPFRIEIDKAYFCPPHGLLLRGWFIDPFGTVAQLRLCCGARVEVLDPCTWVVVKRRDVVQTLADQYGLVDDMCGFLAYAAQLYQHAQPLYLEVKLFDGSVAYRSVTLSFVLGLPAIKEILSCFHLQYNALVHGYDGVIGPALASINHFRLKRRPRVDCVKFGTPLASPRCSIIIPLYGRIDFLEYQLGFLYDSLAADHELIYVLDSPEQHDEAQILAASCYARFERPFTLLILSHNVGYAPANNVALTQARGEYVCFLNSDVFPNKSHWLEYMIATLTAAPAVGIVGALLIYEDGTLQHDGCTFERLAVWGNWPFPQHPRKGQRFAVTADHKVAEAVTGACMVLRRDLAEALGGFDEGYIVGDFEDVDLCLRAAEQGFLCVVDHRAVLFHLERQSQAINASTWRMNLTLYNAWRFQAKWRQRDF